MININGNIKAKDQEGGLEKHFQPMPGEAEVKEVKQPEEVVLSSEILENKDA